MTLYDLLRKLVTGERIWDNERIDAMDLIDKLEALNAFGSSALYTGQHECEPGPPTEIYENAGWSNGPPWQGGNKGTYWQANSRTVIQCKICGREM